MAGTDNVTIQQWRNQGEQELARRLFDLDLAPILPTAIREWAAAYHPHAAQAAADAAGTSTGKLLAELDRLRDHTLDALWRNANDPVILAATLYAAMFEESLIGMVRPAPVPLDADRSWHVPHAAVSIAGGLVRIGALLDPADTEPVPRPLSLLGNHPSRVGMIADLDVLTDSDDVQDLMVRSIKDSRWRHPDVEQVKAMRRWDPTGSGWLPDQLVPGDIAALRYGLQISVSAKLSATAETFTAIREGAGHTDKTGEKTALAALAAMPRATQIAHLAHLVALDAVPYFVPAGAAPVLHAAPPEPDIIADLRLPHDRALLVYATPMHFDHYVDRIICPPLGAGPTQWPSGQEGAAMALMTSARGPHIRHRRLVGAIVHADHGIVRNTVGWIVAADVDRAHPTEAPRRITRIEVVPGRLASSLLSGLLWNTVALIDYASTRTVEPVELPTQPKERRKALKSSRVRRALTGGARIERMRVVDLVRAADRQRQEAPSSGGKVRPHLRRGYWKRVRCGPRNDWWHERRFIGPTVVHRDLLDDRTLDVTKRVMRVPINDPESATIPSVDAVEPRGV